MLEVTLENAKAISIWFIENARDLPWRNTHDPYDVWISEIMLQQTRIEAVIPKYLQFRHVLPDIASLAEIDEPALLRLWEGLGYYNRARNLKKCAVELTEKYNGILPRNKKELLALPGIGPYTCGAILSIAYGIAEPAIDGNVLRVMARLCNDDRNVLDTPVQKDTYTALSSLFEQYHEKQFVRSFTQGLMELGETICLPNTQPQCHKCPLQHSCKAHAMHTEAALPVRIKKTTRKTAERTLCILRCEDSFLLHKRDAKGLLANLYEFYGIEHFCSAEEIQSLLQQQGFTIKHIHPLPSSRHLFTHIEWNMKAYEIEVEKPDHLLDDSFVFFSREEIRHLAIPSAFKKYVELYGLRK